MPKFMKLVRRVLENTRVAFKPLSVHTEAVVLDEVWERVKKLALSGKVKVWYVMTPANYSHIKENLNLKISKREFSEILNERYKWLLENDQRLELHVHLNKFLRISGGEQEKLFKESVEWLEGALGLKVGEYVPGWWQDNLETRRIAGKFGLKRAQFGDCKYIHDYDLVRWGEND